MALWAVLSAEGNGFAPALDTGQPVLPAPPKDAPPTAPPCGDTASRPETAQGWLIWSLVQRAGVLRYCPDGSVLEPDVTALLPLAVAQAREDQTE